MTSRLLAILAILVAIVLLLFGLVFLIAANSASRLLTAGALLVIGAILVGYAIATLRRLRERSPDYLETHTVDLARRLGGELSIAQVQAEFKVETALALATLDSLRQKGVAQLEHRGGSTVYLFKGVLPAKAVKRCPYCGSEFAVRSALHKCPNCGGNLEITKE
jgi:hypothetical protein